MQKYNLKNAILLAMAGVTIGVIGIIAYYQLISWLFITCVILCIAQFVLAHFLDPLKDEMYPYLAACLVAGYYLTDNIPDAACYAFCLYYATAFIISVAMSGVLLPSIFMILVPIGSIVAYFLHAEHIFLITAVFCFVFFLVKHFRGKNPHFAMDIFLWCVAFGISMLFMRDTDALMSVKMLKGVLWGSAAYYIVIPLYAFYRIRVKKDKWEDYVGNA